MLSRTRDLFRAYLRHVIDGHVISAGHLNDPRRELAVEISERLEQLVFIVDRVRALEGQLAAVSHEPQAGTAYYESASERAARLEMHVLTESFYYCASRVRSIARNERYPLPGLGSFECRAVRDIRNQLLEHPEGAASRILMSSFGRGGAGGPVIKPLRPVGRESVFPDAGLFANSEDFANALSNLIQEALTRVGA